jgi:hypothetical protein
MSEIAMDQEPPDGRTGDRKDGMTRLHQWLTIIGVPVGLAIAGWIALQFDALRLDMVGVHQDIKGIHDSVNEQKTSIADIWKVISESAIKKMR